MTEVGTPAYGLWPLVIINAAEFGDAYATYVAATPAFLSRLNTRNLADRASDNSAQSVDTPLERKRPI